MSGLTSQTETATNVTMTEDEGNDKKQGFQKLKDDGNDSDSSDTSGTTVKSNSSDSSSSDSLQCLALLLFGHHLVNLIFLSPPQQNLKKVWN